MNYKKAQAEVITTVLIILLVLAAIVIVWQVVRGTIDTGSKTVTDQSACIGVNMDITGADYTAETVIVRRGPGSTDTVVTGYKIFVGGNLVYDTTAGPAITLAPLQTATTPNLNVPPTSTIIATTNIALGQKVSAAAILGKTVCAAGSEYVVK